MSLKEDLRAAHLPQRVEPLQLTFWADEPTTRGNLLVIGTDDGSDLCVRYSDGVVVSMDADPKSAVPTRFVNSSIQQLARSIHAFERYGRELSNAPDEAAVAAVTPLIQSVREIDPQAVEDPKSWWSLIIEQVEQGFL